MPDNASGMLQVAELERQAMLGCKAGHSMLLDHLAASAREEAESDSSEATSLQVIFQCSCWH